jgi:hypothetical protein
MVSKWPFMVKRGKSRLSIATVMVHLGWLKELHGKSFIWLAEQHKHRFRRIPGWPFGAAP